MKITLPAKLAIVLTIVAGVLQVLNQTVFEVGSHWGAAITVGLVFLAALGIPAVTGAAFQGVLAKLIPAKLLHVVHGVIAAAVAALTLALTLNTWPKGLQGIIAAVVTVLLGLGFGPNTVALKATVVKRRRAPVKPPVAPPSA